MMVFCNPKKHPLSGTLGHALQQTTMNDITLKIGFTNLEQMPLNHSQELLAPWKRLTVY